MTYPTPTCPRCGKRHMPEGYLRCECTPEEFGQWLADKHIEMVREAMAQWRIWYDKTHGIGLPAHSKE